MYEDGKYMFFLTDDKYYPIGQIDNFDTFTNELNCSWFYKTDSPIHDNKFIIYPNRKNEITFSSMVRYTGLSSNICKEKIEIGDEKTVDDGTVDEKTVDEKTVNKDESDNSKIKIIVNKINSKIEKKINQVILITKNKNKKNVDIVKIIIKYNIGYETNNDTDKKIISVTDINHN